MLKPSMKLHEARLKKEILKAGRGKLKNDNLYCFLQREIVLEMKLLNLLKDIIPVTAPDKNIIQKLEREYITKNPHKMAGGNIATSREEILQIPQTQGKLIFPPATKLKKKPGRPRGAKNTIPASGWLKITPNKDGSKTIHYCYNVCHWTTESIKISAGQLAIVEHLIKENYSIEQIKNYLLGDKKNAVR